MMGDEPYPPGSPQGCTEYIRWTVNEFADFQSSEKGPCTVQLITYRPPAPHVAGRSRPIPFLLETGQELETSTKRINCANEFGA